MPPKSSCVGIDLGTTFSSLSYINAENEVCSLRVEQDSYALASAVYVHGPDEISVGNEALHFSVIHPERVARAFKRHMGDEGYRFECEGLSFRAEELSAMVLKKLLTLASELLGPIDQAVISVPAYFDEARRKATIAAGRIAGLTHVDLINEPEAASMAYAHTVLRGGLFQDAENEALFGGGDLLMLVFDLGGGTFDVTIAKYRVNGKFEVIATDGDVKLGGEDWDYALLEYVSKKYHELTGVHPDHDPRVRQELLLKCVEAKKTLSERNRAEITFNHDGKDHVFRLPLGDFESITRPLVDKTIATTRSLIARNEMAWKSFDSILLVGGSSRMPMIGKAMQIEVGKDVPLDRSLPPDTAIAQGAALYAALLSGDRNMKITEFRSVNSHPLGLRVRGGVSRQIMNDVLLMANQKTGTPVTRAYQVTPGKSWGRLLILQGDDPNPDACVTLGQGLIHGLPKTTGPGDMVDVTFLFQENGMLKVTAIHRPKAKGTPTTIEFTVEVEGTMTEDEIVTATTQLRGISIE